MKATIDRSGCIGCGLCCDICPEVFMMGDDGIAKVASEIDDGVVDLVADARDSCPVSVISIED